MPFVLDASVALAWAFPAETNAASEAALVRLRSDYAIAPALWWFETRNALLMAERRQRSDDASTARFLLRLGQMPIQRDLEPDWQALIDLALRFRLTVYDAAYLELAVRSRLALATTDRALIAAASACGIELLR